MGRGLTELKRKKIVELSKQCYTSADVSDLARRIHIPTVKLKAMLQNARTRGLPLTQPTRGENGRFVARVVEVDVLKEKPEIHRGLLIKKEWIDAMLDKDNPKIWELRSKDASPGWFYLIETGGGGIRGFARLVSSFPARKSQLKTASAREKHRVPSKDVSTYCKGSPMVWVLADVTPFKATFKPARGCVDWCRQGLDQLKQNK